MHQIRRRRPLLRTLSAATVAALAVTLLAPLAASRAASPPAAPPPAAAEPARACPQLELADRWYGDVGERLQRVIDDVGRCSGPVKGNPVAVFDWDNTMIKNDISDQTTFWLIRQGLVLQPRRKDWTTTNRWLTPAAAKALRRACGPLAPAGERLPTGRRTPQAIRCADEILSMRLEQTTTDGKPGFAGRYDHRHLNAGYIWMAQLMAGRTPKQVKRIARDARRVALSSPKGATWRVGSTRQIRWVRYYQPQRDLIRTLKAAGITPWVVSASPDLWAKVWSPGAGVPARHTIGIRTVLRNGRVTPDLLGCGGYRDGNQRIMPYVQGKRCWVNQEILGIQGKAALRLAPKRLRPVIAGGDASTDVVMVRDATRAHIVLNRNSNEIMCRAFFRGRYGADGKWLVTPMFIDPLPKLDGRYPCSTEGAEQRDGSFGPVRRRGGVVPDQPDRVHG
ncbi:haloacid dehalogenase-like hydrolase [Nocardioides marinquilinus]|uniref:haloacid dehalogenase-like hydrolase n=1 Tax=Nocardioides marinquilinus TaxID=1210400 RepID=UPI0031ECC666